MTQLVLNFEAPALRLLWEFDLGAWHFMVFQDADGELWLDSRPVEKAKKKRRTKA